MDKNVIYHNVYNKRYFKVLPLITKCPFAVATIVFQVALIVEIRFVLYSCFKLIE